MSAAEPRDGTRDASSTARIPTQDAPGLGRNTGGVRLHRVPNPRWRAVPCASLRAHPRYVALPPVERVLCGASTTPVVDDATLPFVRQHTEQWMAARAGRVTTSTFALALGFWSDDFAVSHLRLPSRGRASRDAVLAAARDATSVAPESAREFPATNANAVTRTRCLEAVEAYNAELAAANGDDSKLAALDAGGWAVTRERAVVAAAGGARDVACALGKEQEASALLAVLGAFPNSYLVETEGCRARRRRRRAPRRETEPRGFPRRRLGVSRARALRGRDGDDTGEGCRLRGLSRRSRRGRSRKRRKREVKKVEHSADAVPRPRHRSRRA